MTKIKEIVEKMKLNGTEYYDMNLLVSKRVWLFFAMLYYLAYLFTVGGFYFGSVSIETLSMITFHLYSVLVVATVWFFYSICEYIVVIYFPNKRGLMYIPIVLSVFITIVALIAHLGIVKDMGSILSFFR